MKKRPKAIYALVLVVLLAGAFALGYLLGGPGVHSGPEEAHLDHAVQGQTGETIWTCSMHPQIRLPEPGKLEAARWRGIETALETGDIQPGADIVVEATGSGGGIARAMSLCRPSGTIVLKSTVATQEEVNLAPIVIDELTVLGSRCGRFDDALAMMRDFADMPLERLITDRYPLCMAEEAFAGARSGRALKVLLEVQ